jgi:hypothetical protein
LSSWYWIHSSVPTVGRSSAAGYFVAPSHISSTTTPASFIPPVGLSRPYWLKVRLPCFDVHCAGRSVVADLVIPRLLIVTAP